MAREKTPFTTCFFYIVVFGLIVIAVLLYSMDYIQDALDLDKPESAVGRAIDEMIPQAEAVNNYARAKNSLQVIEMKNIKDSTVMFYLQHNRPPKSLQELVKSGSTSRSALKDLWEHDYLFLPAGNQEVFLVSGGADRIKNTADDKIIMLMAPDLEADDIQRGTVQQLVEYYTIHGTTEGCFSQCFP